MHVKCCLLTESVRLDVWLDVACLFKTRSEAQQACKGGKVDVNGRSAKPHREIKAGDVVEITRTLGRKQRVVVRAVLDQHIPKAAGPCSSTRTPPRRPPPRNRPCWTCCTWRGRTTVGISGRQIVGNDAESGRQGTRAAEKTRRVCFFNILKCSRSADGPLLAGSARR